MVLLLITLFIREQYSDMISKKEHLLETINLKRLLQRFSHIIQHVYYHY